MIIFLSLLVAVIGLLLYVLATNPKVQEIGRLAFFAGLFVFLMQATPHMVGVIAK